MKDDLDRWRSLAEELGLPTVAAEPQKAGEAPVPPPPPAPPRRQVEAPPRAEVPPVVPAPEPAPLEIPAAPPVARAEPVAVVEETADLPPITSLDPPHLDPMLEGPSLDRLPETGMPLDESAEPERPRGRGRRGQRGGRRRGGERSDAPAGEPEPAREAPSDESSRRRGGGRGRRGERRPEPEPEPEEVLNDEEVIDHVEEEDVDDGPDDNLADLNLPSWADIIGSLYRPER